jgi:hypothetical protein
MKLSQEGFGLDTELTAMMLHAGVRPYEVPITYNGRTLDEGKKITWRDGWSCVRILVAVRMRQRATLPESMPAADALGVVVPMPMTAPVRREAGDEAVHAAT